MVIFQLILHSSNLMSNFVLSIQKKSEAAKLSVIYNSIFCFIKVNLHAPPTVGHVLQYKKNGIYDLHIQNY
jgi:hypothetical protein